MEDCPGLCCGFCRICCFQIYQVCCCVKEPPGMPVYNVLCLGITNAGKTTLLSVMTSENTDAVIPTVGFIIKDLRMLNAVLKVKELGGGESIRQYWDRYYQNVDAVIFVVDGSCTHDELQVTTDTLHKALSNNQLSSKPWLILCNKQDLEGACTEERAIEVLKISEVVTEERDHIMVKSCSSNNVDGLHSTFEKFASKVVEFYNPGSSENDNLGRV